MSSPRNGLTQQEADRRLQIYGFNEFGEPKALSILENLLKILADPMGLMLLILSILYWMLGKHSDALVLLIAYVPIAGVDVLLELRSQKALRSLKKTLKSTCLVIREGKTCPIPVRELVPGDLLILEEGQTLPADGKLLEASNLTIDESSVTGESLPIEKPELAEALSGTTVLTGAGIVEIEKTGFASQIGSIAKILKDFQSTSSPLLGAIKKIARILFLGALALALLVFLVEISRNHSVAESLIMALTLAMAAIPEEFPLVFTLYLSVAAYRLSKQGILVKSLPAVETLGRVDIICTDKTGTLTEGKFLLENILATSPLPESEIMRTALVFACERKAVDAMEASIFEWVEKNPGTLSISGLHSGWELQFDYPFDAKEKTMCHVWKENASRRQFLAMKGALEGVLEHCSPETDKAAILALAKNEAGAGRRILGLAYRVGAFSGERADDEANLTFLGILSFTDPVRASVPAAVRACTEHGIRLKMLTGDHLLTAHSIADKIGLPHQHDELFSGPDLEKLSPASRLAAFRKGSIFARLKPEQKLELVQAIKSDGSIVAMTGDGINDAPALKLADIGISMGERATDVARSSAQLVLLKNDFGGIVTAVLEGRRVLKSLGESFGYLIAFHIPVVSVAVYQAFFLDIPILHPIHIVLLELIVHPVSAFVFVEPVASRAPKRKRFISLRAAIFSSLRGIGLTFLTIFAFYLAPGTPLERSSVALLTLVAGNAGLLLGEKGGLIRAISIKSVRALMAACCLLSLAALLAFVPFLAHIFAIASPAVSIFALLCAIGIGAGALSVAHE